jgi:amino acid adenylation domain-containing protein
LFERQTLCRARFDALRGPVGPFERPATGPFVIASVAGLARSTATSAAKRFSMLNGRISLRHGRLSPHVRATTAGRPKDRPKGAEPALRLPTDAACAPSAEARLERHSFELRVPDLGGAITPEALLVAAFGISLHRYSGQSHIPLRATRRTAAGLACWTRPLCLRTEAGTTCRGLWAQVDELLRREARPGAAGAEGGAAITWFEAGGGADAAGAFEAPPDGPDAGSRLLEGLPDGPDADLHLLVAGGGEVRHASFVYNANLFRRASVERFAGHLGVLLAHIAAHADAPIAGLPLLTPAERRWLDAAGRGRERPPEGEPVHRRFERHAASTPDAVALRFRDGALTYAQLNARANRLARHLAAKGVGAEGRVVVCLEPSFDAVIALLGVLKAGAAYVPLDPTYPAARAFAILGDTAPGLVVSRRHLVERLGIAGVETLTFDDEGPVLGGLSGENLDVEVGPDQTAYIFYTSGTTGQPKGVMASQANLSAYIDGARERYGFGPGDVMPAIARFGFSISMFELMLPLAGGGTLVLLDRDHVLDPARMARTLAEVTFFHAGPSLLKHLLPQIARHPAGREAFAQVRHASTGGDMVAPEVLEALKEAFSNAEVFVIYGCSEISCMGCTYPVPRGEVVRKTYVGAPFDNVIVRVLDGASNPVPVGVAGEVHVAGGGVVKGYLNRPELTAERFVELEGRRFYRTGDVGRLSAEGWLELLGRHDFQIKVRGVRIELGEVEYALRRAPGVRDGVVAAKGAADGEKALVAYVVLDRGAGGGGGAPLRSRLAAVRRHLAESLPDYMVPASYVELESLPLNHNMKVDRLALPDPGRADDHLAAEAPVREPETPTERRLAAIWAELLGAPQVGLDDYFFELGGHSVLAAEFIARAARETGVRLDGMDILREPLEVVAALCDERSGKGAAKATKAPRAPADDADVTPCHFGPGRSLYGVLHGASSAGADEAVLICAPPGQELVRARFVLTRLARRLAARGVPALQFDYFGCGDSLGEGAEATCGRWRRDVADADRELRRKTGAARVVAVGVRLGATLLCEAAAGLDLARIIVWDPVCDGAEHYAELVALHRRYLRGLQHLRLGRRPARLRGAEELLGATYSAEALRELRGMSIAPLVPDRGPPLSWLITSRRARQRARFAAVCGARRDCEAEALDFDCGWHELARLEDVLPDVGIAGALAAMAAGRP